MYSLVGVDGNAFSIMGYVGKAMKECGKPKEEVDNYYALATSADYSHLLATSMNIIDELNEMVGEE